MEVKQDLLFCTPLWRLKLEEHVKYLNKICDPYIKNKRKDNMTQIKKQKTFHKKMKQDMGLSHHSLNLVSDINFKFFIDIVNDMSHRFMAESGFNIEGHTPYLTELWVQEFSKNGGGHHSLHNHWNQQVSGFYFLKASKNTSCPKFVDPRPGALMTKILPKNQKEITHASSEAYYTVSPGDMIIFPGYLPHEFTFDYGIEPFRFIHWNMQYVKNV